MLIVQLVSRPKENSTAVGSVPALSPAAPAVVRPRRGGNRLGPDHPAFGRAPHYQRAWSLPPDAERRDRNQRRRVQIAADAAAQAGDLPAVLHRALTALLSFSDDRCSEPVFPSLESIARRVHGDARYGPSQAERREQGDVARPPGQRTAARWIAELRALGWVRVCHRRPTRLASGRLRWHSSLIRIDIPDQWRNARHQVEDEARRRSGKGAPTPKAPQNTGQRRPAPRPDEPSPSALYEADEQRRRAREAGYGERLPEADWRRNVAHARRVVADVQRRRRDSGPGP